MSFSVVIPLWNKRAAVGSTVASVLRQSWPDFELIVVDDGSTDGSPEVLAEFDDPRLRLVSQANAGPGAARNRGIREARHDWIAFLDADDLWAPDHLAELDRIRRAEPEAGLIGTAFALRRRDGGYDVPDDAGSRIERIRFFACHADGRRPFCASTAAIPRRTFETLGGFGDERAGQDSVYFARVALDRAVAISTRVTAAYRQQDDGLATISAEMQARRTLGTAGDVAPVVALLLGRRPMLGDCALGREVDRYIDFRLNLCVRNAARNGDFRTLRAMAGLYLRPPPRQDRLIMALARLPAPVAHRIYRLGFAMKGARRRILRSLAGRRPRQAPAWMAELLAPPDFHAG